MSRVSASVEVNATLAEVWGYYFDADAWPAWVDGFGRVESSSGYPEAGGSLRWVSGPAGRGTVTERVIEHEPRKLHRIAFEDPETSGELKTTFAIQGEGTLVTQEQQYGLERGGPLARLTDLLFIRSQMRGSLARSLGRLKLEVEEVASAGA
jgi:polyketide cyclase/dehydrase/lipid transport protein